METSRPPNKHAQAVSPSSSLSPQAISVQIHLHRPRLPLAVVSAVGSARALPGPLVFAISDFLTRKRWTITSACRRGDLQLLQRVVATESPSTHPLYRAHTFTQALRSALHNDNPIELLECVCAYCPTGSRGDCMMAAACLGKVDVLDWLVASDVNVTLESDLLDGAVGGGHLNVLQWVKNKFPENDLGWEAALELASSCGDLVIVKWIHENVPHATIAAHKYRLEEEDRKALKHLFEHGYKHIGLSEPIDSILLSYWSRPLNDWLEGCINATIHNGRTDSAKWLLNHVPKMFDYDNAFETAVENGDLGIVQLFYGRVSTSDCHQALESAAMMGHRDVAQWLFWILHEEREGDVDEEAGGVAVARTSRSVLLKIAEMLHTSRDEDRSMRPYTSDAELEGQFGIAKWLVENSVPLSGTHDIDAAASCGRLEMLIWLHGNSNASCSIHAMAHAAAGNHLDIVKWLHENRSEGCTTNAMNGAAGNGHLEVVKWLHENRTEGCTVMVMDEAAWHGHLEVIKWLHEHQREGCTYRAMDGAADRGHLEVVKWLHENRTEGCSTDAMDKAAKNGHLRVIKWLHENRREGCTTNAMDEAQSVEVVEWLHTNRSEGCTVKAMDNALDREDVVNTLLFLHVNRTESCTIHAAVRACCYNYVDVVQWLQENYPNVAKPEEVLKEMEDDPDLVEIFLEIFERVKRQRIG